MTLSLFNIMKKFMYHAFIDVWKTNLTLMIKKPNENTLYLVVSFGKNGENMQDKD